MPPSCGPVAGVEYAGAHCVLVGEKFFFSRLPRPAWRPGSALVCGAWPCSWRRRGWGERRMIDRPPSPTRVDGNVGCSDRPPLSSGAALLRKNRAFPLILPGLLHCSGSGSPLPQTCPSRALLMGDTGISFARAQCSFVSANISVPYEYRMGWEADVLTAQHRPTECEGEDKYLWHCFVYRIL